MLCWFTMDVEISGSSCDYFLLTQMKKDTIYKQQIPGSKLHAHPYNNSFETLVNCLV